MRTEVEWDKKLNINTVGRDAMAEDEHHYPYEPTPYSVLERIIESDYINADDVVVDYGCGKGRVGFFLNSKLGCRVLGIDFDERMYKLAQENRKSYKRTDEVGFTCVSAEKYEITEANCFYFFNPFSIEILQSVIGKIRKSYYDNPRDMKLFFYYPSVEYVSYLMTVPELCFVDEIDCQDLFDGQNERERVLIFGLKEVLK